MQQRQAGLGCSVAVSRVIPGPWERSLGADAGDGGGSGELWLPSCPREWDQHIPRPSHLQAALMLDTLRVKR